MKKLLLILSFMTVAFTTNIKTADHSTINETTTASEQTVSTENNDQYRPYTFALEEPSYVQPVKEKTFLDLSIREAWNKKIVPFVKTKKLKQLCIMALTVFSLSRIFNIWCIMNDCSSCAQIISTGSLNLSNDFKVNLFNKMTETLESNALQITVSTILTSILGYFV